MRKLALITTLALLATGAQALDMIVEPYLQYPTQQSIIVRWETDIPSTSIVEYAAKAGEDGSLESQAVSEGLATYHEVKLTGLDAQSPYFYRVTSVNESGDATVQSPMYTFSTAIEKESPFGFAVLCDTQSTPKALNKLATLAYAQRPCFTMVGGDLVSNGESKIDWTGHFFPNMAPLNARVPLIPTLGNHDKDSHFYYDYFSLPDPEYYYQFSYGNLDVFMLDSQRPFHRMSDQYQWLEKALADSTATWKIVMFHKPPYSSDENDYGDTSITRSVFGDFNTRMMAPLFDTYNVDIVWCGHIHSYERTWPIRDGKPVAAGEGPIYLVTGGGGGGLENAGPERSPYSAKVYSGHHYCYVTINNSKLRMEAHDLDDRIFDWLELEK